jgi:peptidoglycan hydrolase-like amidase
MDENQKKEIENKIKRQKYIKANAEATILKLQAQLETEMTRSCRNKPKITKDDSKVTKKNAEVTKNDKKVTENQNEKVGFFETVFGN